MSLNPVPPRNPPAYPTPTCQTLHLLTLALLATGPILATPIEQLPAPTWQQSIEHDWLAYEQILAATNRPAKLSPGEDAAGACDGIKNGRWGFHTGPANQPWWQVDLGAPQPIAQILVYNRCDAESASVRALKLSVKLSEDGNQWQTAYTHDGIAFLGFPDHKPLQVTLPNPKARFVRIQLPGTTYLHLDEVEIFGPTDPAKNLALQRPANQVSTSQWSTRQPLTPTVDWNARTRQILAHSKRLGAELRVSGVDPAASLREADQLHLELTTLSAAKADQQLYLRARWIQRKLVLANPLLDFDAILITKRVPGSFNHMSDQYYGWWSRPGGGIYLLRNFKTDSPTTECLTGSFKYPGNFLRPALSCDGQKVLFAWCRHYPHLAAEPNKLDKKNVPEDAFYHLFEMDINGSNVRRLTHGKYDDFDGRYLPDGRIVFLSTRRGQSIQVGRESALQTVAQPDLPDCYVRCGGDASRPVAVYTLHTMNSNGTGLCAISPFEMFEWEPSVANDGTILYSRWDYIDRDNMPYMSLWATHPDGTNTRLIYGNHTRRLHCTFEPRSIPNSHKIILTASAHHSQTMGSLVLLDPTAGNEGEKPITRLTPEVEFPEAEAWPRSSYASPWPLSERFHLVSWSDEGAKHPGPNGWNRWHAVLRPKNGMGIFLFDAAGNLEPLYRDPDITCMYPIPLRSRPQRPVIADSAQQGNPNEGRLLLLDVYQGLKKIQPGEIKSLRIIAVPAKTQPWMNEPAIGITRDDPGKCVLGTVPVEQDGSAYFRLPAGVAVFFQALDDQGMALQTMRTATHVQPGETASCIGCHESRYQAPPIKPALAMVREPSKITVGPHGSWPLRFDHLVQPVLDQHCVSCHNSTNQNQLTARFDLTPPKAYESLVRQGKPSLAELILTGYRQGQSNERAGLAARSPLLRSIRNRKIHPDLHLNRDDLERLILWMDTYAQKSGSFSPDQEQRLKQLRDSCADFLIEPDPKTMARLQPGRSR